MLYLREQKWSNVGYGSGTGADEPIPWWQTALGALSGGGGGDDPGSRTVGQPINLTLTLFGGAVGGRSTTYTTPQPQPQTNYTPWIIAGGALVTGLIVWGIVAASKPKPI